MIVEQKNATCCKNLLQRGFQMKKQITEMVTGNFYKFASQKRMDKPSCMRYINCRQENIL